MPSILGHDTMVTSDGCNSGHSEINEKILKNGIQYFLIWLNCPFILAKVTLFSPNQCWWRLQHPKNNIDAEGRDLVTDCSAEKSRN